MLSDPGELYKKATRSPRSCATCIIKQAESWVIVSAHVSRASQEETHTRTDAQDNWSQKQTMFEIARRPKMQVNATASHKRYMETVPLHSSPRRIGPLKYRHCISQPMRLLLPTLSFWSWKFPSYTSVRLMIVRHSPSSPSLRFAPRCSNFASELRHEHGRQASSGPITDAVMPLQLDAAWKFTQR
jgi:hypothetical protein